jgi:phosphonatase-like hydrolase
MKDLQLVIFDLAGTTVQDDAQVGKAFIFSLSQHGMSVSEEELRAVRGTSKREAIRTLVTRKFGEEQSDELSEKVYLSFRARLIERYESTEVKAMPGAFDIFEWLRINAIKIAVTTGFDRVITDLIFRSVGWNMKTVDVVVCGDDVSAGRPAPYLIFHAMEATGVQSVTHVANVGDTINDLYSAANAGVRWNIGVCSGAHTREHLEKAPHTHIIPTVASLRSVWEY